MSKPPPPRNYQKGSKGGKGKKGNKKSRHQQYDLIVTIDLVEYGLTEELVAGNCSATATATATAPLIVQLQSLTSSCSLCIFLGKFDENQFNFSLFILVQPC